MVDLILVLIAVSIFAVYNGIIIKKFGIPKTLSDSFYLLDGIKKNLGYIFTGMMFVVPLLLMPAWFGITEQISTWSHYLTVLPFLGAAGIMFVGAAPAFRSCKMESTVHETAAKIAAIFSLLWVCIVCWQFAWIILLAALICYGLSYLTKTKKTSSVYWLEMIAFMATFITMIVECIMLM